MPMKYKESASHGSRVRSLARRVYSLKAKKERIIGTRKFRKQSKKRIASNNIIKSQGLDKVSSIVLPQSNISLDKTELDKLEQFDILPASNISVTVSIPDKKELSEIDKPIIKVGGIQVPEIDIQLDTKPNTPGQITGTVKLLSPNALKDVISTDDYRIAIPSYNRADMIQVKTLALLNRHGIPPIKIDIFVANRDQYDLYASKVPKFLYDQLIIGHLGLKNQRNFINNYYPEGEQIVQMDDDLSRIVELVIQPRITNKSKLKSNSKSQQRNSVKKTLKPITDLDAFIKKAFNICRERGIYLWGVYPLANSRFMSPRMTTDLRFIVGPFWGIINRHRPDLHLTIDEKENAERTLQHYVIDHAVLRFNNIGIETRYYKNKGGMQNEGKNRKEESLKSVYYLHKKYPTLTKIYLGKKSGIPEIKMRNPQK
jgi:hypothetical protein